MVVDFVVMFAELALTFYSLIPSSKRVRLGQDQIGTLAHSDLRFTVFNHGTPR
jgi:hypothetical protein